ncbi:hypothetical protein A5714_00840 [Mycobacterium sp. E2462]|uniref:hypothetical protein n=1 Tax=Mycobacterium sp. E2462 TaxID=1834133 RepID=UPI0007FFFB45|nr:hypothetical protein [Mycobacterium sp. E2462]OBI10846.1 hypothetical protein A5714_17165 [Mycobacterium sp. E2462]OBI20345.1 hypothetical protein A5714_00840 [Mycobacterium sp. E2462]
MHGRPLGGRASFPAGLVSAARAGAAHLLGGRLGEVPAGGEPITGVAGQRLGEDLVEPGQLGTLAAGVALGRHTASRPAPVAGPAPSITAVPGPVTAAPPPAAQLDGSFRLETERTKQTYNDVADPQPPDIRTWWAFRSSCGPQACTAAAAQLDDNDHSRAMSPGGGVFFLRFTDGQWLSQPVDLDFPCFGPDGSQATQSTTLVLALRPQPPGDFVGEETVTVQTNECGQQSAVIRIPAVASRRGEVPPAVAVPDPAKPPESPGAAAPTLSPYRPNGER